MRRLASAAAAAADTVSADIAEVAGEAKRAANARWLFARSSFT